MIRDQTFDPTPTIPILLALRSGLLPITILLHFAVGAERACNISQRRLTFLRRKSSFIRMISGIGKNGISRGILSGISSVS